MLIVRETSSFTLHKRRPCATWIFQWSEMENVEPMAIRKYSRQIRQQQHVQMEILKACTSKAHSHCPRKPNWLAKITLSCTKSSSLVQWLEKTRTSCSKASLLPSPRVVLMAKFIVLVRLRASMLLYLWANPHLPRIIAKGRSARKNFTRLLKLLLLITTSERKIYVFGTAKITPLLGLLDLLKLAKNTWKNHLLSAMISTKALRIFLLVKHNF
mmetsp:Transcript_20857/g.31318  ORF Transcript_20857/g.31318 Transcript_20857/m.31318 type:complete len:214 (+) Transcript_20857:636-1277(+)